MPQSAHYSLDTRRLNSTPGSSRNSVFLCQCQMAFDTLEKLSAHKALKHFFCGTCRLKFFLDKDKFAKHCRKSHADRWCEFCQELSRDSCARMCHLHLYHEYCRHCNHYFKDREELDPHIASKHPEMLPTPPRTADAHNPVGRYYTLLDVSPRASHDAILQAARRAHIAAHPDRHHRPGLSDQTWAEIVNRAKEVGQAADVLSDMYQRIDYDHDVEYGQRE